MTRTPHDRFAKQVLEGLLHPFGQVNLNQPIVSEPRAIDVWFVPNPHADLTSLGRLGQMAHTLCLIEAFRNPINSAEQSHQLRRCPHLCRQTRRVPYPVAPPSQAS